MSGNQERPGDSLGERGFTEGDRDPRAIGLFRGMGYIAEGYYTGSIPESDLPDNFTVDQQTGRLAINRTPAEDSVYREMVDASLRQQGLLTD